jgi:hypothetical protein
LSRTIRVDQRHALGHHRRADAAPLATNALPRPAPPATVPFTPLSAAERAIQGTIEAIDFKRLAERAVEDALARHQGRV